MIIGYIFCKKIDQFITALSSGNLYFIVLGHVESFTDILVISHEKICSS